MAVEPKALTAEVTWSPPVVTNGQITAYLIEYHSYADDVSTGVKRYV